MNYRHVYMLIIEHAKSEMEKGLRPISKGQKRSKFSEQYFEFHHILPKSLYPNWSKRKSNLVALSAREHFFCHQLLIKIYPTYEMWGALFRLAKDGRTNRKVSSREYERIRINFSKLQSERKLGCVPWNKGKINVYTDEQLKYMSDARKNATTPETIKKIKEARAKQDMSWRHDWHPSDEARKQMSSTHLGMKWWNNGIVSTQAYDKPGEGWSRGRLYSPSEEAKKKVANANRGRRQSEETRRKRAETMKALREHGLVKQCFWICQETLEKKTALEWKALGFNVYRHKVKGFNFIKYRDKDE